MPRLRSLALAREFFGGEIGRGTYVNLGFALANAVLAAATSVFAGNALGPAGIGILSLGFLVLEFAGMVDNLASGGFMRDYAGGAEPVKLATALRLKILLGVGTALLLLVLAEPLASILEIPTGLLLAFAIVPATATLTSVATMLHEARRNPWRRSSPGTAEALVKAALYGGFWLVYGASGDVLLYAWGAVGASVVGAVVAIPFIPSLRVSPWDRRKARRYLEFGLANQATGALNKLIFWIDILILDIIIGHYEQGLYRVAYSVMAFVPLFAGTIGTFLFPALSEAAHHRNPPRVRLLFRRSFGYVLAIALPLVVATFFLAEPILGIFGPAFREAAWILQVLAVTSILPALLVPFEALFPALDRPSIGLKVTAAMAATNVALDLALIPSYGVVGALVGTAAAFLVGLALALFYSHRLGVFRPGGGA